MIFDQKIFCLFLLNLSFDLGNLGLLSLSLETVGAVNYSSSILQQRLLHLTSLMFKIC